LANLYRHTQIGWTIIIPADIAAIVAVYFGITSSEPFAVIAFFLLIILTYLFYGLTVIGTRETLEIRFGIGIIRKRFNLSDIATAESYRTAFWDGWGIRYYSGGWIYNVSGFDAVRLTMTDGKHYIIGTDEPRKLLGFLEKRG
jgi:hypothetical protein